MHPTRSILKRIFAITQHLSPNANKRIVIACFPKTASTFLRNVISELTGYKTEEFCLGYERNEQNIYLPTLIDHSFKPIVNHMHVQATGNNLEHMNMARIKPIILVRDIFDTAISLRDHLVKTPRIPMAYIDRKFATFSIERQLDMVVDMCMPWFFSFYVSWYRANKSGAINAYWTTYEQLIADKIGTIEHILECYNIPISRHKIVDAINTIESDKQRSNKNIGKRGRGKSTLSDDQRSRIIRLATYYPDVDFSLIGIDT